MGSQFVWHLSDCSNCFPELRYTDILDIDKNVEIGLLRERGEGLSWNIK